MEIIAFSRTFYKRIKYVDEILKTVGDYGVTIKMNNS